MTKNAADNLLFFRIQGLLFITLFVTIFVFSSGFRDLFVTVHGPWEKVRGFAPQQPLLFLTV
jgi:hypothetical protein